LILAREELSGLVATVAGAGHRVIEAFDAGHVLQQVMRHRLEAVILPDEVEPVDGEELLPIVRRLTTAAIAVAGRGGETEMAQALFRGADAYLRYPDEESRVRSRIRALLRRPRVRRPAEGEEGSRASGLDPFASEVWRTALAPAA
jgi:DNA-binding response OmpR family regulator